MVSASYAANFGNKCLFLKIFQIPSHGNASSSLRAELHLAALCVVSSLDALSFPGYTSDNAPRDL